MHFCKMPSGAQMPALGIGTWRMGESGRRRARELEAVKYALELGYPIYARDSWMRTGKDRVQVEATGVPVNIGDVRVCPGDLVRGDADGVVVIPKEHEDQVLATAESIQQAEDAIREAVRGGMTLREARLKHGYHSLQTRGVK